MPYFKNCMFIFLGFYFFFFNDTATTEIYTLSLHDALPISRSRRGLSLGWPRGHRPLGLVAAALSPGQRRRDRGRSEEHTSELQSRPHLVCRLLLEKKKNQQVQVSDFITLQLALTVTASSSV